MRLRCFLLALVMTSVLGCSEGSTEDAPAMAELTGVVVDIDGSGFDEVSAFTLRSQGTNHVITVDPEREYGFRLSHLHAHLQGAEPVRVGYREIEGKKVAITIEDA